MFNPSQHQTLPTDMPFGIGRIDDGWERAAGNMTSPGADVRAACGRGIALQAPRNLIQGADQ